MIRKKWKSVKKKSYVKKKRNNNPVVNENHIKLIWLVTPDLLLILAFNCAIISLFDVPSSSLLFYIILGTRGSATSVHIPSHHSWRYCDSSIWIKIKIKLKISLKSELLRCWSHLESLPLRLPAKWRVPGAGTLHLSIRWTGIIISCYVMQLARWFLPDASPFLLPSPHVRAGDSSSSPTILWHPRASV